MDLTPPDSNGSSGGLNGSPIDLPRLQQEYIFRGLEGVPINAPPVQFNHNPSSFNSSSNSNSNPSTAPTPAASNNAINGNRLTVPAACVACRTKHLKCDGANPCSRCSSYNIECTYVRSRRGYKGPRRNPPRPAPVGTAGGYSCPINEIQYPGPQQSNGHQQVTTSPLDGVDFRGPDGLNNDFGNGAQSFMRSSPTTSQSSGITADYSPAGIKQRCLESFFHNCHAAHPFLLPKAFLLERFQTGPYPPLEAAMVYMGSYHVKEAQKSILEEEVRTALSQYQYRDGFVVQSLLLLCISFDGNNEQVAALNMLVQAQDIALEIGMHQQEFCLLHGEGNPVLEESWRRTWWELYIVDGMIAGVHQRSTFRMNTINSSVLLPCEEHEYISGRIPRPHSIEELENDDFGDDDTVFSSFAFRITAIRNLGRILSLQEVLFGDDPIVAKTDAHLVNWELNLPSSKKQAIGSGGQVDEMLFQAQMIAYASTIMLHRPHSQLDTSVARNVTSCAPFKLVVAGQSYNIHAAKIIHAAENITKLIQLPTPLTKHTHFFTCVITMASIVHLSCWAALLPLSQDDNLKQQIKLNTGSLKTIAEVWPSASRVGYQVKGVAREVFASRKAATNDKFWSSFTEAEMMQSMMVDQEIMAGFQLT